MTFLLLGAGSCAPVWERRPIWFGDSHKGYYPTGELRFVCTDGPSRRIGESTSAVSVFRFKRILYDRCGNVRLVCKGSIRIGCWEKEVQISSFEQLHTGKHCPTDNFQYPSKEALLQEMQKEL